MAHFLYKISLFILLLHCAHQVSLDTNKLEVKDRYYPRYHLAPPSGWMNDPNGFSVYKNWYHLFYQFNPNSSLEPGIAHWGHAKSHDLIHWQHLPIALYPDEPYDEAGVFSGSALIEDDNMYIYYTGNVKTPKNIQHQCLATSDNSVNLTKYKKNPIIEGAANNPNIRDPKVWKFNSKYYMVLGNSINNNTLGQILLYTSDDKIYWQHASVLEKSNGSLGYMWECPDFFELNGRHVLLFSPQGIAPQGDKYRNLYQTGYIVGRFDYKTNIFTPITAFKELDHGHDFYATQTIVDQSGQRIIIAWFDMWEQNYPERYDGFTGMMTIPRRLYLNNNHHIMQKPINIEGKMLRTGSATQGEGVLLKNKAGVIKIMAPVQRDLVVLIESTNATVNLTYSYLSGTVTLDRGGKDGVRRTNWRPHDKIRWIIYVDASSVELFCGAGEVTFSSRFFPDGPIMVRMGNNSMATNFEVISLPRTVPKPYRRNVTHNTNNSNEVEVNSTNLIKVSNTILGKVNNTNVVNVNNKNVTEARSVK